MTRVSAVDTASEYHLVVICGHVFLTAGSVPGLSLFGQNFSLQRIGVLLIFQCNVVESSELSHAGY